jgi:hypothetical protein
MVAPKAPELLYSTMQTMREMQSNSSMAMTGMVVNLKFVRIDLPVWDHLVEVDSAVVAVVVVVALAEAALAMEVEVEVSEAVETSVEALEVDMEEEVVVGMAAAAVVVVVVVVVAPVVALVALIKAAPNLSPQMPSPTLLQEVENETQSSMLKM